MPLPLTSSNSPQSVRGDSALDTTSAESRIREAATLVGMTDEHRLQDILQRMNKEFVLHAWQLPAIDSSQWRVLNVPIGLAAAVKQLHLFPEQYSAPLSSSPVAPSPPRSMDQSLLALGSSTNYDSDAVFEDEEESVVEHGDVDPLVSVSRLPEKRSGSFGLPDPPPGNPEDDGIRLPNHLQDQECVNSGEDTLTQVRLPGNRSDVLAFIDDGIILPSHGHDNLGEKYGAETITAPGSLGHFPKDGLGFPDSLLGELEDYASTLPSQGDDEIHSVHSSEETSSTDDNDTVSTSFSDGSGSTLLQYQMKMSRRAKKRNAALAKVLAIDSPRDLAEKTTPRNSPYGVSPVAGNLSFQEEWAEVQTILRRLPIPEQRALLCQLLIVENGATSTARAKLVENVICKIREVFAEGPMSKDELDLVTDHLRFFAGLRSEFRKKFGKVLFAALSQLHAPTEKASRRKGGQAIKEIGPEINTSL